MDFSTLFSVFLALCQAEVLPKFQNLLSFCFELQVMNESKCSMPWPVVPLGMFTTKGTGQRQHYKLLHIQSLSDCVVLAVVFP